MNLEQRDIFKKENLIFDDTGEIDVKGKRSCLVLLVSNGSAQYYLSCATHNKKVFEFYQKHPDWNYMLTKKKIPELQNTCLVNLKSIYKEILDEDPIIVIPSDIFKRVIRQFKEYQSEHPHPLYDEIKDLI
jgi:hypothetical protein